MFLTLFVLFFFLGLGSFSNPRFFILAAIILALCFPFGNHYAVLHYFKGVSAIDGFFLGLLPLMFKLIFEVRSRIPVKMLRHLAIMLLIFGIYFFVSLEIQDRKLYMVLKELRPLLHFLEFYLLMFIGSHTSFTLKQSQINTLSILAGMTNVGYFFLGYMGLTEFEDLYYQANSNRYIDLSTYFSIYYILYHQYRRVFLNERVKNDNWALLLSLLSVLVSNSRVILLATVIGVGFLRANKISNRIKYILGTLILGFIFLQFSTYIGQERIAQSLNREGFIIQITQRFSPAIEPILNMEFLQCVFGYGLGYYFEIPWFNYRDIDPFNISIDSAYLTHFVKQGLIGIIVLFISLSYLTRVSLQKLSVALLIFWLIQFLVEASLFQNTVFGATFFLFLYQKNKLLISNELA